MYIYIYTYSYIYIIYVIIYSKTFKGPNCSILRITTRAGLVNRLAGCGGSFGAARVAGSSLGFLQHAEVIILHVDGVGCLFTDLQMACPGYMRPGMFERFEGRPSASSSRFALSHEHEHVLLSL